MWHTRPRVCNSGGKACRRHGALSRGRLSHRVFIHALRCPSRPCHRRLPTSAIKEYVSRARNSRVIAPRSGPSEGGRAWRGQKREIGIASPDYRPQDCFRGQIHGRAGAYLKLKIIRAAPNRWRTQSPWTSTGAANGYARPTLIASDLDSTRFTDSSPEVTPEQWGGAPQPRDQKVKACEKQTGNPDHTEPPKRPHAQSGDYAGAGRRAS
jgi:hypothetical protein